MLPREDLLLDILRQPTAPYREHHVIARIRQELEKARVPFFADPIGNLVLGVASKAEYLKLLKTRSAEPVRMFIAHLDHPGFHGTRWRTPSDLEVQWFGGSPTKHLDGASVWLATREGNLGSRHSAGLTAEMKLVESGRAVATGLIKLTPEAKTLADARGLKPEQIYGGFAFRAPVWHEGDLLYTKAADDLVGAFSILSVALDLFGKKPGKSRPSKTRPPFLGLLTRAEEVGFIGAIGHFELGWLEGARRPVLAVSLETSRQLTGAEIGKGPVVRLGDRTTVFDSGALGVFTEIAARKLPGSHQRRVMDGGSCEATAATTYGVRSIGISVPLGNYHNQSFEGGSDSRGDNGPAPEFVSLSDVGGLLTLCHGLLEPKLPWAKPWNKQRAAFKKSLGLARELLQAGP